MRSYSSNKKIIADHLKKIGAWLLQKKGLTSGVAKRSIRWKNRFSNEIYKLEFTILRGKGGGYVNFRCIKNDEKKKDCWIKLATTPCNFGGERLWFMCPLTVDNRACNRRVGVLYECGNFWGCRHCLNLTYKSRGLSGHQKKFGRPMTIQEITDTNEKIKGRTHYKGKMTKRYKRFLYKQQRSKLAWNDVIKRRLDTKYQKLYNINVDP